MFPLVHGIGDTVVDAPPRLSGPGWHSVVNKFESMVSKVRRQTSGKEQSVLNNQIRRYKALGRTEVAVTTGVVELVGECV